MGVRRVSLLVVPIIAAGVLASCGEKTYEVAGEVVTASQCRRDADEIDAEARDQERLNQFLEGRGDLYNKTALGQVGTCGAAAHAAFLKYRSANDQAEVGRLHEIHDDPVRAVQDPPPTRDQQAAAVKNELALRADFEREQAMLHSRAGM